MPIGVAAITESLSDAPTKSPETIVNDVPIGYAEGDTPTLGKLQAGSTSIKWVAVIEGTPTAILSDASTSAVQTAWSETDWSAATVYPVTVSITGAQSIDPKSAFTTHPGCTLRVLSEAFGELVNRRLSGDETELTATADRNDTTLNVKSTSGFASSGTVHLGNEAITYTGTTATTFTGCTRGVASPFGCDTSGSGGSRFAGYHTVSVDSNYVQRRPLVTQYPQGFIDRRVGVYQHSWNGSTLNSKVNAQLVFAGRIVGIADDPETFETVIELEHCGREFEESVVGRDMLHADMAPGLYMAVGRQILLRDWKSGSPGLLSNALTVVSGAPASVAEIQAGYYEGSQLVDAINAHLGAEKAAGRIYGYYSWAYAVSSNDGIRTQCRWRIEDAGTIACDWTLICPGEVSAFLGLKTHDGDPRGQVAGIVVQGKTTSDVNVYQGEAVPFTTLVFKPHSPGHSQEFADAITYELENERGTFVDQLSFMPTAVKASCDADEEWGIWLIDEKALAVASYASGVLTNVFLAPFPVAGNNETEAVVYVGRRADEAGPVTVRQVFVLEGTFFNIFNALVFSSGTAGYNHSTHDSLGNLGIGMPGSLLASEWVRSVGNLPETDAPIGIVIDEPTRFFELIGADLRIRRAFVRWKNEGFELCKWQTPSAALATIGLNEANKAAPSNQKPNHRTATEETDEWQQQTVKIDYARDFAIGRDGKFLRSVQFVDQAASDASDGGTGRRITTLKMRNSFAQWTATGAAVESLFPGFIATMPMFSQAGRKMTRSIDVRLAEAVAPGDIALVSDDFARDPFTGERGFEELPAVVVSHSFDYGGPNADGSVRQMGGDVKLAFLDLIRPATYAPAANIDSTWNAGGFSAGYNHATSTIRCEQRAYSNSIVVDTRRGPLTIVEGRDATRFADGDSVLVCERDPTDPANPTKWFRTVASQDGDYITFTATLSAPAWDATKQYFVVPNRWDFLQDSQQNEVFQADDTDGMVFDDIQAWHFSVEDEAYDFHGNAATDRAEYVATLAYGDGRPWDPAFDAAMIRTSNCFGDRGSAHQNPVLNDVGGGDGTSTWRAVFASVVFFGFEMTGETVTRSLTVAPFFRSSTGVESSVRVTLCRAVPMRPADGSVDQVSTVYRDSVFGPHSSQTTEWSTTSTTWAVGEDKTLSIAVQDLHFGTCWLVIEANEDAEVRGLSKCLEGIREVP